VALGSTQPLAEMSTKNLPGGKVLPALKADNLSAICKPMPGICGNLDVSQLCESARPVVKRALPFLNEVSGAGNGPMTCSRDQGD
jgi:hypothetical protein